MEQDKVVHDRKEVKKAKRFNSRDEQDTKKITASFSFSDIYQAKLPDEGPMRYRRPDVEAYALKQLRRGDYSPELMLDLHGLTKESTKQEVAAMIFAARKERIDCVGIVHGIGEGILKKALPHYLVQHPHVRAFHQAPLEYGGQGALLVLLDLEELDNPFGM